MKKLIMLMIVVFFAVSLVGCKKQQETKIKEDYLNFMHSQSQIEMDPKDIIVLDNYGTYNDAVVVRIKRGAYEVITTVRVGGIDFTFNNTNTPLVWKAGDFFELSDAYSMGILTQKNLEALAKKINN